MVHRNIDSGYRAQPVSPRPFITLLGAAAVAVRFVQYLPREEL